MLKEPQKVGTLTPLWKSFEGYMHSMKNAYYRYKDNELCICLFQLKYNNAKTLGPCLLIFYPENTNPISLPVTSVSFKLFFFLEIVLVLHQCHYYHFQQGSLTSL